jgi:hypothetical protein
LTFDSQYLLTGHYLDKSFSLITVTATANVPPQGKRFLLFKDDQMQMGKKFVLERCFINPLAFVLQMVRMCNPI